MTCTNCGKAHEEIDRLRTQLAGCLTAAEGHVSPDVVARHGDYGWSPAYQAVVELRLKYEGKKIKT